MPQKPEGTLPLFLNLDVAFEKMSPSESPFIKGTEIGISKNPLAITGNPTGEGQNALDLSPTRSNGVIPKAIVPAGFNKNAGSFYSETTRETYYANYNDQGNHGLYVVDGDSGQWSTIIIDPELNFTPFQEHYLADHRWKLRVVYGSDGSIIEKFLLFTNGHVWQGYISVIAAIKSNGFNASQFPYWTLQQPHYDRRELLEWAVRPPMYNPIVTPIPNTPADAGTVNRIIDQAFEFAIVNNNTDGRQTTYSPYSLPLIVKSEDFLNNPDVLPKKALLTLPAGSPLTESIDIMVRFTAKKQLGIPSTVAWGEWFKYIRIYKFSNQSDVLQSNYWLRTNPWANYNYDPVQNTIQYVFDNSILPEITSQDNAARLQNDIPIKSVSLTDVNDAIALGDNLYGYDNLPSTTIQNLGVSVQEKINAVCPLPTRKVTLYAVAPRPSARLSYESQVGFYNGQDTQMRWGSLEASTSSPLAGFSVLETKEYGLDFADHSGFVCYAKGTPYYVVGQWYEVDANNNLTKLQALLDFSNTDVLTGVNQAFLSQKYYVCVFTFELPAGRYDFCLGRHNVNLSQDFRNTSTYVRGIANSRIRQLVFSGQGSFVTESSIVSDLKEMEIDCTNVDVDVWGNGRDLFYIHCPSPHPLGGDSNTRFIEGYLKESPSNQIGVELFPYIANLDLVTSGHITDKNGFYYVFLSGQHNVDTGAVQFQAQINCQQTSFQVTSVGNVFGPINNGFAYLTDHNGSGSCNWVLVKGKITDLTGLIPYQNVSISIANGGSVNTGSDGTFTLHVHNGQVNLRTDNIYVNAAGNFLITLQGCAPMPLTVYNEKLAPCFNCQARVYPIPVNFLVLIQGGTQQSLKQNASYQSSVHCADLAGRLTFENVISQFTVPSFLQRNDVLATFLRVLVKGALNINPDLKWMAFSVSNQVNTLRYFQWVGDSMKFIDNQGNVVNDPSTAVFISIAIDSLYNYNVSKNFSVLASYQFSPDDHIRFLDDGNGNLLNTAVFGEGINLPILGSNYNQAVQTAGIVPNSNTIPIVNTTINNNTNTTVNTGGNTPSTVITQETTQNNTSITLYVKFDAKLAALKDSTGFWIEIYTPAQQAQRFPYNELQWYPIINGELAIFKGVVNGQPVYDFPTSIDIPFWDTYLFFRNINIPNVGDKFLNHPFESPNISDSFGANVTSGGRKLAKNDDAIQQWAEADIIKSDAFIGNGIINGIGTFRDTNRHNFSQYPYGAIQAMNTERSIIFVLCRNDWFTVSFDFHFTYPNAQGVMIVNLDNNISTPAQKIGSNFGLHPEDTGTVLFINKEVQWLDRDNLAWAISDYRDAKDMSDLEEVVDGVPRKIGVKSYFLKKINYMTTWNNTHDITERMDVVAGLDPIRNTTYVTFRRRRNNSNDPRSYANQRRSIDLSQQETIAFSNNLKRWIRFNGFTPEGYSLIKGNHSGLKFLTFAAGLPYGNADPSIESFLNFYGVQTEAAWMTTFNKPSDLTKVFQAMSTDSNLNAFIDLVFTGQDNVFSYIPVNFFKKKEGIFYSQINRDMYSYPKPGNDNLFRSMFWDGSRIVDTYCIVRFVTDPNTLGRYFQINNIFCTYTKNYPDKK